MKKSVSFFSALVDVLFGLGIWQRRRAPLRGGREGAGGQAVARRSPPSQPLGASAACNLGASKVMDVPVSCLPRLLSLMCSAPCLSLSLFVSPSSPIPPYLHGFVLPPCLDDYFISSCLSLFLFPFVCFSLYFCLFFLCTYTFFFFRGGARFCRQGVYLQ